MNEILAVSLVLGFSFGIVKSIFGFAGNAVSLVLFAFLFPMDQIKEFIVLNTFANIAGAFFILASDFKSICRKSFKFALKWSVPGIFLGVLMLSEFNSKMVLMILGIFLIFSSCWSLYSQKILVPPKGVSFFVFLAGLVGGAFGTIGPFIVLSMRDKFKNKAQFRVTLAFLFFVLNLLRIPLYASSGQLNMEKIIPYWPALVFICVCSWIGHKIHIKMSESVFRRCVSFLLLFSGILLFFK